MKLKKRERLKYYQRIQGVIGSLQLAARQVAGESYQAMTDLEVITWLDQINEELALVTTDLKRDTVEGSHT